ncbi:hypothetical protein DASC09_008000 [Saccharomycopsis crataegensis]|uniref:pectinesterase n=1 Tax=Saccharomycopsis crataegensis TaxID=43959 RepID=A0AAV5QEU4_9ASCO|nr:hypothetical protein DASC09_008000 [Saccharomycopsis crataegensis]
MKSFDLIAKLFFVSAVSSYAIHKEVKRDDGQQDSVAKNSYSYAACQYSTDNVLEGCPDNTLVVDGSGTNSSYFKTIQSAVDTIAYDSPLDYTILILPGIYNEQVNVTQKTPITLLGVTNNTLSAASNQVTIYRQAANHNASYSDNVYTANLIVAPTYNASATGAGPAGYPVAPNTPWGNKNFRVYNIDFDNDYAPYSSGPSLVLSTAYSYTSFYRCGFYSYQDTIFIGKLGSAFITESIIAGQTDFLYGFGTLWIDKSELQLRSCGGGIIAWKGSNMTQNGGTGTYSSNNFGCYISNSRFVASNETIYENSKGKCYLGRNWNNGHRSVLINNYMDHTINPQGYVKWTSNLPLESTVLFGEFNSYGEGFNETARIQGNITTELTYSDIEKSYSFTKIFGYESEWIDFETL